MNYIKNYCTLFFLLCYCSINAQGILTKKQAISLALKNNYGIRIAKNNIKIAKNNASYLNTNALPSISSKAGSNYSNQTQNITKQNGQSSTINGAETKSYNASIQLNYTIFDGLGRKYNTKQLQETHQLNILQARETIENAYIEVFTTYFKIAQFTENTLILKEVLETSKNRLKRAEYQYDFGQATKLEVLNAKVDLNNDIITYKTSQQQVENAKRSLALILGATDLGLFTVETDISFLKLITLEALLKKAKKNNITLLQSAKQIVLNNYNLKKAKTNYLPKLGLTSSYGWNKSTNPATSFLAENSVTGLNVGLNATWNIFDGGTTKTKVRNAKIAIENQEIRKQQQEQQVEIFLKNLHQEYQNMVFIYQAQKENVLTNTTSFKRTQEQYKLGRIGSIEFRQSQNNLRRAQSALINAKFDAKLKELEILQLVGELLNTKL